MKKILIIEPDKKTAGLLQKRLLGEDTEVYHAIDGQIAVEMADKFRPDVVVLELALPDQNGLAFLHEFRSYEDWRDVPVIINSKLSLKDRAMNKSWALLGVNNIFYKPTTSLAEIKKAVDLLLTRKPL